MQAEFAVRCVQGCFHGLLIDYEGNVAFRRALGDGDEVHVFHAPAQLKVRPAMPGVPRMFSPTTATMAILESTVMCSTL